MFEVFWCITRNGEHRVRVQCAIEESDGTVADSTFIAEGSIGDCLLFLSAFAEESEHAHFQAGSHERVLR